MKARTIVPLIIGLGVGFFAIKMGIDMVQKAKGPQDEMVEVLVTDKPIEVATRITESMVTTRTVPKSLVPGDALTDVEKVVGRVSGMSITRGVQLTASMLAPIGAEPGLRARIPNGYRAVSISVTEESAVAGFVMPGSRVDVLAGGRGQSGKQILSDVEVGAVGQSMSEVGKDGKTVRMSKSVTLFLRPEQVMTLHRFAANGRRNLRLALLGHSMDREGQAEPFWANVLAKAFEKAAEPAEVDPGPVPKSPARKRHVVEVVRGSEVEHLVFVQAGKAGEYSLVGDLATYEEGTGAMSGDYESASRITEMRE